MDGLRCAPEMCPVDIMTIMTASPAETAFPMSVSVALYLSLTMGAAVAPKIRMKVPTNSAPSYGSSIDSIYNNIII